MEKRSLLCPRCNKMTEHFVNATDKCLTLTCTNCGRIEGLMFNGFSWKYFERGKKIE